MTPEQFEEWMTQFANLCMKVSSVLAFALVMYIIFAIIPTYVLVGVVVLLIISWFTKGVK